MIRPQKKHTRLNIRIGEHQKEVITRAAAMQHTTVSNFILETAYKTANQVIAEQTQIVLPSEQWKLFCEALDSPPKKIPALQKLLNEH